MVAEKDVITLIVESGTATSFELRVEMENSTKHSTDLDTKTSREVREDYFRAMGADVFELPFDVSC